MPIIRSSRVLYKWLLPVVFGARFSSCGYGVELRVVCPVCGQHEKKQKGWGIIQTIAKSNNFPQNLLHKLNDKYNTKLTIHKPEETKNYGLQSPIIDLRYERELYIEINT